MNVLHVHDRVHIRMHVLIMPLSGTRYFLQGRQVRKFLPFYFFHRPRGERHFLSQKVVYFYSRLKVVFVTLKMFRVINFTSGTTYSRSRKRAAWLTVNLSSSEPPFKEKRIFQSLSLFQRVASLLIVWLYKYGAADWPTYFNYVTCTCQVDN